MEEAPELGGSELALTLTAEAAELVFVTSDDTNAANDRVVVVAVVVGRTAAGVDDGIVVCAKKELSPPTGTRDLDEGFAVSSGSSEMSVAETVGCVTPPSEETAATVASGTLKPALRHELTNTDGWR
jgi:hypothetical protein